MIDTISTIFIGVFSGIITSILIWICIQMFKKILIPWYQQTIYRGINVSGEWISKQEYSGNVLAEQTISLNQKGHLIKGTLISRNKIPNKGEDTTTFKINGEIFDNYVDIEYQINDKKLIGRGSQLLKVKDGGEKL
ncbi:MAG: hypothetical protein H8E98_03220 [Bacteroidetes bacterium]|nr:hypothetical protein [Bacteroidota bacterium]